MPRLPGISRATAVRVFTKLGYLQVMIALERIAVNPMVMSGKPCIRGLRVTVANVPRLLAAGHTPQRILAACPYFPHAGRQAQRRALCEQRASGRRPFKTPVAPRLAAGWGSFDL